MKLLLKQIMLILSLSVYALATQAQNKAPNIIFILADDLGYGDLGCYGQTKISTPNIDALANKGFKSISFYAGSTVCAPSRAAFLSGLHTGHVSIRGNDEIMPEGQAPLPDSVVSFAMLLQKKGYNTAAFGKWGLGFIGSSGSPNNKGFKEFFGYNCQRIAHDYFPPHLWHNNEKILLPENEKFDSIYAPPLIHNKAIQFIKQQNTQQPFFLFLPYTFPHGDVLVPKNDSTYLTYIKKFNEPALPAEKQIKRGYNATSEPYPHAAYATMVSTFDKYVGEVVKTLAYKGLLNNTIVIITSDNGPHKEGGGDPVFFNSNGSLRGIKRDFYEGGIRVPFVAYAPNIIKPCVSNTPFALWDMFPTFLNLANIKYSGKVDGKNILPILLNKQQKNKQPYFYWEFSEMGKKQALRWGNWKLVKLNANKTPVDIELYDLSKDASEKNNVALQYPAVVKTMLGFMQKAHTPNSKFPLFKQEEQP